MDTNELYALAKQDDISNPLVAKAKLTLLLNSMSVDIGHISKREKFLVDDWLSHFNFRILKENYEKKFPSYPITVTGVKKWLARPKIAKYVTERMTEDALFQRYSGEDGKKLWLKELLEMRDGRRAGTTEQVKMMDLIGKYMGYETPKQSQVSQFFNVNNMEVNKVKQQIRVVQEDGGL